jgi:hypothetical protein
VLERRLDGLLEQMRYHCLEANDVCRYLDEEVHSVVRAEKNVGTDDAGGAAENLCDILPHTEEPTLPKSPVTDSMYIRTYC